MGSRDSRASKSSDVLTQARGDMNSDAEMLQSRVNRDLMVFWVFCRWQNGQPGGEVTNPNGLLDARP
jgi:hypothetical protein